MAGPHPGQDLGHGGTLHLLPAAEYPLWQAGLGTYRHYLRSSWLRYFGLTREELERLMAAVAEALDGTTLTREELAAEVGRRTGPRPGPARRRGRGRAPGRLPGRPARAEVGLACVRW